MAREIKFRIWDNTNKSMTYPNKYCLDSSWFGVSTEHYLDDSVNEYPINDNEYVIDQFTGLKDKNGLDIYEGDIVYYWSELYEEYEAHEVFYWNEYAKFCLKNTHDELSFLITDELEVIGNIHKNKAFVDNQ